ncbi:hypothetical protein PROFUN_06614 [Planoprotostelium fungivorum]|uniref:Uncharacterized protein n=1 Tax=Planoprotostelium fungivorum TaxID=1890364 RepID=A0A2P6MSS9_9EUKA|nr:hypothetical protein PROFUN_06614 [Planoprotostelium fungivorum]
MSAVAKHPLWGSLVAMAVCSLLCRVTKKKPSKPKSTLGCGCVTGRFRSSIEVRRVALAVLLMYNGRGSTADALNYNVSELSYRLYSVGISDTLGNHRYKSVSCPRSVRTRGVERSLAFSYSSLRYEAIDDLRDAAFGSVEPQRWLRTELR